MVVENGCGMEWSIIININEENEGGWESGVYILDGGYTTSAGIESESP